MGEISRVNLLFGGGGNFRDDLKNDIFWNDSTLRTIFYV